MSKVKRDESRRQMDLTHVMIELLLVNTEELLEMMNRESRFFCSYLVVAEAHLTLAGRCIHDLHEMITKQHNQSEEWAFWENELTSFKESYLRHKSLWESRGRKLTDPTPFNPSGLTVEDAKKRRRQALQSIVRNHRRSNGDTNSLSREKSLADIEEDISRSGSNQNHEAKSASSTFLRKYLCWTIAIIVTIANVAFNLITRI